MTKDAEHVRSTIPVNNPVNKANKSFMARAVHAYHRSERDSFALSAEALGVCKAEEWPKASARVRRYRDCSKLWGWALRRWGKEWPRLEYDIREQQ